MTSPDEPTDSALPPDNPVPTGNPDLTADPAPAARAPRPQPEDATPDPHARPDQDAVPDLAVAPDEQELERVAVPATVRRAPKFGAFITAGALVGALVGFVLAVVTSSPDTVAGDGFISFLGGDGTVRLLAAGALAVLGGLVGGALAVGADRRSTARR